MTPWDVHREALRVREAPQVPPAAELERLDELALELYAEQVEAFVTRLVWSYPHRDGVSRRVTRAVRLGAQALPGARDVVVLTGPNAVGKSTFMREWVSEFYRRELGDDELDPDQLPRSVAPAGAPVVAGSTAARAGAGLRPLRIPVVWLSLPGRTSKTTFQSDLARYLGYTGTRAPAMVLDTLGLHGVRVLVLDDCHALRFQGAYGEAMLHTLKTTNDKLGEYGGTLVMVGANLEDGPVITDGQTHTRALVHRFDPLRIDTPAEQQTWQRMLKTCETHLQPYLPASAPGFLFRHAGLLWRLTQGYPRDLKAVLAEATGTAVRTRTWTITPDMLTAASFLSSRAIADRRDLERTEATTRPRSKAPSKALGKARSKTHTRGAAGSGGERS